MRRGRGRPLSASRENCTRPLSRHQAGLLSQVKSWWLSFAFTGGPYLECQKHLAPVDSRAWWLIQRKPFGLKKKLEKSWSRVQRSYLIQLFQKFKGINFLRECSRILVRKNYKKKPKIKCITRENTKQLRQEKKRMAAPEEMEAGCYYSPGWAQARPSSEETVSLTKWLGSS